MPEPTNVHYGKEWTYGTPEARDKFRGMASPELWQMLVNYKGSKGPAPDPGQDYLMKQRRPPEDEAFARWHMGEAIHGWGQPFSRDVMRTNPQGQQPTPGPTAGPTPTATPNILEGDELLRWLLEQKLKAQEEEANRFQE
jgi:hypothetical protein